MGRRVAPDCFVCAYARAADSAPYRWKSPPGFGEMGFPSPDEKFCRRCSRWLPFSGFAKHHGHRSPWGEQPYCRQCSSDLVARARRKLRLAHTATRLARRSAEGVRFVDLVRLVGTQGGECFYCGTWLDLDVAQARGRSTPLLDQVPARGAHGDEVPRASSSGASDRASSPGWVAVCSLCAAVKTCIHDTGWEADFDDWVRMLALRSAARTPGSGDDDDGARKGPGWMDGPPRRREESRGAQGDALPRASSSGGEASRVGQEVST